MRKIKGGILVVLLLISLVGIVSASYTVQEFPICTDPNDQRDPDIYGDIVVWYDDRNGPSNEDIYGYNLSTNTEFPICTAASVQQNPSIHENIVVWEDYRDDTGSWTDCNIYGYNFSTHTEFQVTTHTSGQYHPVIYGKTIVWADDRNGPSDDDIYGYDMGPDGLFGTGDDGGEIPLCIVCGSHQRHPAIYGSIVVWMDERNGSANPDIYGYDMGPDGRIGTGDDVGEFPITTDPNGQVYPAIYGNIVVWQDHRNGPMVSDIYGYTISTHTEFPITTGGMCHYNPDIYGDIVVWMDGPAGLLSNYDLYGRDLSTYTVFPIATYPNNLQRHPAIYENIVVWMDARNYPNDIYGAMLGEELFINPIVSFMPVKNYHLAQVNTYHACIEENLPEDIPDDVEALLDEMQTHLDNANTTQNTIYANNELLKALELCEEIAENLGITCS